MPAVVNHHQHRPTPRQWWKAENEVEQDSFNYWKSEVKAAMIASKEGVPVDTISKYLENQVGYEVEYQQFGFKNIEEFLFHLDDILEVRKKIGSDKNFLFIKRSADLGASAHIRKLVDGQRSRTRRRGQEPTATFRNTRLAALSELLGNVGSRETTIARRPNPIAKHPSRKVSISPIRYPTPSRDNSLGRNRKRHQHRPNRHRSGNPFWSYWHRQSESKSKPTRREYYCHRTYEHNETGFLEGTYHSKKRFRGRRHSGEEPPVKRRADSPLRNCFSKFQELNISDDLDSENGINLDHISSDFHNLQLQNQFTVGQGEIWTKPREVYNIDEDDNDDDLDNVQRRFANDYSNPDSEQVSPVYDFERYCQNGQSISSSTKVYDEDVEIVFEKLRSQLRATKFWDKHCFKLAELVSSTSDYEEMVTKFHTQKNVINNSMKSRIDFKRRKSHREVSKILRNKDVQHYDHHNDYWSSRLNGPRMRMYADDEMKEIDRRRRLWRKYGDVLHGRID